MMFDFVSKHNSNELCNAGKNQISMQGLFIPCPASGKTEIIFDVVYIPFNNSPDFISIIPFSGSADGSGISAEIFFRININHAAAS